MDRYEEALERAKKGLPIDEVFPELKESKDERIRKILIHIVKGACDKYGIKYKGDEITEEKLLAYLEKQKEVKWSPSEGEMSVLYKLCYISNQITAEDDTELTRLYQDLKREYFNGHSFENMFSREEQKEQKLESCDCSRDEESYTNGIHHVLMNPEAYGLIKLKPAKWSEEFLRLMGITISQDGNQVCVLLGENLAEGIAGFGNTLADAVEEFKKEWRQFDRFRKATWKPSEEQMSALKNARHMMGQSGDYYDTTAIIDSLITDLQKLL